MSHYQIKIALSTAEQFPYKTSCSFYISLTSDGYMYPCTWATSPEDLNVKVEFDSDVRASAI